MNNEVKETRFYQKKKRNRIDHCNICGLVSKLTYDHVPPKCCFNDINIKPIEKMSGETERFNPNCSQNGLKYRTICNACNNGLLAKYDKAMEDVVEQIKTFIEDDGDLKSGTIKLSIKINAFTKAICGHLLAMKNDYDEKCLIDIALRKYVLSTSELPPQGYQLLMRFYPFSTIFSLRDASIVNTNNRLLVPDGTISVLSAFPLSFILNQGNCTCGFTDLFEFCSNNIEEIVELQLDIRSAFHPHANILRHEKWPCNISDDDLGVPALLCSSSAAEDSAFANRKAEDILSRINSNR